MRFAAIVNLFRGIYDDDNQSRNVEQKNHSQTFYKANKKRKPA